MKLPNNYGSISKLSGNRRRPYMVRKSLNGTQMVIGYYDTKEKALQALAEYNRQPSELPKSNITLTTLYKQWLPHHAPTTTFKASWMQCSCLTLARKKCVLSSTSYANMPSKKNSCSVTMVIL